LVKESGSSKSMSHKYSKEKIKSKSVSRHQNHSPRHSNRRASNNSNISPFKRYKRSGVDELRGEMNKIKPPTFDGEHKEVEDAKTWFLGMRKYFQLHNYSFHAERRIVIYQLKGKPPCGGINLRRCNTLKRKVLLGGNSRSILRRST
jgi:hypothetical protein